MRFLAFLMLMAAPALADPVEIVAAEAQRSVDSWRFSVTVAHPDTGWDHYADGWRVELEDGTILGIRVLHHPHVEEQPFTRSLGGVMVPTKADKVYVRAKCSVDGWGTERLGVALAD